MHGLLSSQSCYHSVLVPCWFISWTSEFLYPYILDFVRNLFQFSCHYIQYDLGAGLVEVEF